MKKLALSIAAISAAMATGVYAETLNTESEVELNLTGEVEVAYVKGNIEDSDAVLGFENVTLGVMPVYETETGVTALANFEVDFAEALEADPALSLNKAYVGLGVAGAEVTVGKQDYASAEFGIGKDIAFGSGSQLAATSGNDVVKLAYSLDGINVIASLDIAESEDESAIDVYGEYTVMEGAKVAGTFQSHKANADADAENNLGVSGEYTMDALAVAAEFSYDLEAKNMGYEVAGSYQVAEAVTVAAGVGQTFYDDDAFDTLTQYYVNSEYKVHDNASAYLEVGGNTVEDSEIGYAVGMKVKF